MSSQLWNLTGSTSFSQMARSVAAHALVLGIMLWLVWGARDCSRTKPDPLPAPGCARMADMEPANSPRIQEIEELGNHVTRAALVLSDGTVTNLTFRSAP